MVSESKPCGTLGNKFFGKILPIGRPGRRLGALAKISSEFPFSPRMDSHSPLGEYEFCGIYFGLFIFARIPFGMG